MIQVTFAIIIITRSTSYVLLLEHLSCGPIPATQILHTKRKICPEFLHLPGLQLLDAFSKWLEIIPVKNATSSVTVDKLRGICLTHGLPDTIVTINAAVFTNTEMKELFTHNSIKHITKRAMQTFKLALKRLKDGSEIFA